MKHGSKRKRLKRTCLKRINEMTEFPSYDEVVDIVLDAIEDVRATIDRAKLKPIATELAYHGHKVTTRTTDGRTYLICKWKPMGLVGNRYQTFLAQDAVEGAFKEAKLTSSKDGQAWFRLNP